MQKIATTIAKELQSAKHFAVYEPELDRSWPHSEDREREIAQFAKSNGWRLRFYKEGLVAIFDKTPALNEGVL